MSKDSNRLTAKKIERLTERGRYHDGHGLILQITRRGAKSWLLRYERDGRERWHGLGALHTVTLKEARERARAARLKLLDGTDPIDEKRAARTQERIEEATATTFKKAAERYMTAHEADWKNAVHRDQWRTTLDTYACVFVSALEGSRLTSVTVLKLARGMRPGITVHGFRSAFRDWAGESTNFPREIAEAALAHAVGDATERAYRRGDALEKRRKLMVAWASFCAELPTTDNVIPLRG